MEDTHHLGDPGIGG